MPLNISIVDPLSNSDLKEKQQTDQEKNEYEAQLLAGEEGVCGNFPARSAVHINWTFPHSVDHPKTNSGISTISGQITGPRGGGVAPILAPAYSSHHQVAWLPVHTNWWLVGCLPVHTNWWQLFSQIH